MVSLIVKINAHNGFIVTISLHSQKESTKGFAGTPFFTEVAAFHSEVNWSSSLTVISLASPSVIFNLCSIIKLAGQTNKLSHWFG